MTLSAEEQFMLELINRARLDPLGEAARYGLADLNQGLAAGTITATVKQVLAPNDLLDTAATDHSLWMLANDTFDHIGVGGSNAEDRIRATGYAVSGFWWGENLGQYMTTGTIPNLGTVASGIHQALFLSAGHRANILRDVFREVGLGLETGVFTSGGTNYNASLVTQNYAQYGTEVFLTGVAYNDGDNDKFYSVGEGTANVTFAIGAITTQTAAAGGYALKIAPGANQTVTVTPSGGSASTVVVDLSAGNVKLDLVNGSLMRTSGHLTLVSGVANAELLGAANLNLTGNDLANQLTGNSGNNVIRAGLGNDVVVTGNGADYVYDHGGDDLVNLGDGNDYVMVGGGKDTIAGGTGIDTINYFYSNGGVTVDLLTNALAGGWAADDAISGFERAVGSNAFGDQLRGTNGSNVLLGYGGNDLIYDRAGNDYVDLGDGNDYVLAGNGVDTYHGGNGTDTISYYHSSAGVRIDLASNVLAGGWAADDTITGFERADGSNTGHDTIMGTTGDNVIRTYGGNDLVYDRGGNDLVNLGDGNDSIIVGGGADTIGGGNGIDEISYFYAASGVNVDLATNALSGGWAADDVISGFERVSGSNAGGDTLAGSAGANILRGNGGADSLDGRGGADILDGGTGNDTLTGGTGADNFVFRIGYQADRVSDFLLAEADILMLDDALWAGMGALSAAQVVSTFASVVGSDVLFDFGGGNTLTLAGLTDTTGIDGQIIFI